MGERGVNLAQQLEESQLKAAQAATGNTNWIQQQKATQQS